MSIRSALGTMLERIGLASRKSRRRRQGIQTANKRAYFFEPLEERQLLSISTWTGASTTDNLWSDAANWNRSGGGAPRPATNSSSAARPRPTRRTISQRARRSNPSSSRTAILP